MRRKRSFGHFFSAILDRELKFGENNLINIRDVFILDIPVFIGYLARY